MLDTTVLLSGIIWPRFPYEVLQHALSADFQAVLSPFLIRQARRKFAEKFPAHVSAFEEFLEDLAFEEVPDPSSHEVRENADLMRDITDIPVALAAINAGVDYLVSEDKDFTASHRTTEKLHQRLRVMLAGTFLREVMGWTSEDLAAIRRREWTDLLQQ